MQHVGVGSRVQLPDVLNFFDNKDELQDTGNEVEKNVGTHNAGA